MIRYLLTMTLLLTAAAAHAGGLWLRDFGGASQGRSNAAEAAGVESSSTVAHNPAGMALLDESQYSISGFALAGNTKFDLQDTTIIAGNGDGGQAASTAPAGGLSYVHKINDRWSAGFGVAALTGASLDYGETWVGRYQAQKVDLLGLAAIPAVSWQATEKLSLGLGLPILYTKLKQDLAIPDLQNPVLGTDGQARLKGDDTNVGVQAGAIYEFTERTRLGVMYMTKFDQKMDGDTDVDLPAGGSGSITTDADLPLAEMVRVGLAHAFTDEYTLYLGAGWENWSKLDTIIISGEQNAASVPVGWKDTWHGSAGLRYQRGDGFEAQVGVSYDSSPVDNDKRRAELPVDRQWRYSTSVSWQASKRMRVGTYITYMDLGSAHMNSTPLWNGEFKRNSIVMIGATLQYYPKR